MKRIVLLALLLISLQSFAQRGDTIIPASSYFSVQFNTYTCLIGQHDFKPNRLQFWSNNVTLRYYVVLNQDTEYILSGADQRDWNKGVGLTEDLFSNTKNSMMWAWRWNPDIQKFEHTLYCHVNGTRQIARNSAGGETIYYSGSGDVFIVDLTRNKIKGEYIIHLEDWNGVHSADYTIKSKKNPPIMVRNIGTWFGGNRTAPRTLRAYISGPFRL